MNTSNIYKFFQDITPPYLFRIIKKSPFYPFFKGIILRLMGLNSEPTVTIIQQGPLSGLKLKFNPNGIWQKQMLEGSYDSEILDAVTKLPLVDKTVFDIGAHIGIHSLLFAKLVGPNGSVHGFEPNQYNAARFREIVALNPEIARMITVHQIALGDRVGETDFLSNDDIEGGSSTGGFLDEASTIWERKVYLEQTKFTSSKVLTDTIDHLVQSQITKPPYLIKIDVEGAEQLVLAGGKETIIKYKPTIIIELHSIFSAYDTMRILNELEYSAKVLHKESDGRIIIQAKPKVS